MSRAMRLLLAFVFLVQCVVFVTATCYAPDGSERTGGDIGPCSNDLSDPLSRICCNVNRPKAPGTSTNASEIRDTCLPNGLCENLSLLKDGSLYLQWGRNFCTSRDWSTGQCMDGICTNTVKGRSGSQRVIPCTGKNTSITWCCGDNDDCCSSDDQSNLVSLSPTFTIAEVVSIPSVTSTISSVSAGLRTTSVISSTEGTSTATPTSASANAVSTAPASSPSNTATPSPAATTAENTGLSKGAKAGIAIGAIAGAILLVALGVWISKALAWRKEAQAAKAQNYPGYYPGSDVEGFGAHPQKYAYYAEVDATSPPVEVLSTPDPVEAPNTEVNFRNGGLSGFFTPKP
ncbi:hypothetical protein BU23DRAFT_558867 [Bimuria novae-zelandiae CBS 107.79]|uniref:Mid2 domain-containing protein n=1 Tax=Bimuria novae-zelandiae CBS 107.79 TaxID=1447943 RepID=A0A6A5UTI3_9PLEO|nr:hypothetical protein BU23DRAFT_558867 [Bimuria novae-zelandiae CBS 107.79]